MRRFVCNPAVQQQGPFSRALLPMLSHSRHQNSSLAPIWICREPRLVLVITPKPELPSSRALGVSSAARVHGATRKANLACHTISPRRLCSAAPDDCLPGSFLPASPRVCHRLVSPLASFPRNLNTLRIQEPMSRYSHGLLVRVRLSNGSHARRRRLGGGRPPGFFTSKNRRSWT